MGDEVTARSCHGLAAGGTPAPRGTRRRPLRCDTLQSSRPDGFPRGRQGEPISARWRARYGGPMDQLEAMPDDWTRALAIAAHPDDLEYGAAAAIAVWTNAGKDVRYLLATKGEA